MTKKKCRPTYHVFIGKAKICQCGKCEWDEINNRPQYIKQPASAPATAETGEESGEKGGSNGDF